MTGQSLRALRQQVEQRANNCCEYCRSQELFSTQTFSLEHIMPRSQNGETSLDNLALACQGCNNFKYNKTQARDPVTNHSVPLFHPRQQLW
jgi:5-methylcytosine-specific restriction endonuclease McrA